MFSKKRAEADKPGWSLELKLAFWITFCMNIWFYGVYKPWPGWTLYFCLGSGVLYLVVWGLIDRFNKRFSRSTKANLSFCFCLYVFWFIYIPFRNGSNLHKIYLHIGISLLFTLVWMIIYIVLVYRVETIWYLLIMFGICYALVVPIGLYGKHLALHKSWQLSLIFGIMMSCFIPQSWLLPKKRKEEKRLKDYSYQHGVRVFLWCENGECSRPQARFVYRMLSRLDGENLSVLQINRGKLGMRVVGGNQGKVCLYYSEDNTEMESWQILSRIHPEGVFTKEDPFHLEVCNSTFYMPLEFTFRVAEIKDMVKTFENHDLLDLPGLTDPGRFYWFNPKQSEPYQIGVFPDLEELSKTPPKPA